MVAGRAAAVFLLLVIAAVQTRTQDAPAAPAAQVPFRAGVNVVRVDATVTDRQGNAVTTLTRDDFEVIEDGRVQPIEQFRLVQVDGNPKPGDPAPRDIRNRDDEQFEAAREDVRIFAILLADYQVELKDTLGVREALTCFVDVHLRPNDLVAVLTPLTTIGVHLFTYDRESTLQAIRQFEGRQSDYRPRNAVEGEHWAYATKTAREPGDFDRIMEGMRHAVVRDALKALAVRLGSMREGRKSLVFVSGGFAQRPRLPLLPPLALELREMTQEANRHHVSIYPVDPNGLTVGKNDFASRGSRRTCDQRRAGLQMSHVTLRDLADDSDGRALVDRSTLEEGFARMMLDAGSYYLLGYSPTNPQADGRFHPITVRVKRPGVDVRARKGYWAPTTEDERRTANPTPDLAKPVLDALATLAPVAQDGRYGRTWIGTARGDAGKTRVTVVWEPVAQSVAAGGASAGRREPPARVALTVSDGGGGLIFRGPAGDTAIASQRTFVFDAAPGTAELRLVLESAGGETLDREIRSIEVPDLTTPDAAMSTARVYRGRTARELQAIAADPAAVPLAAREFARTDRLLIRFDAYAPAGESAAPSAAVLNRNGAKMFDVPVTAAAVGATHQIDLGLASTPAGDYLLEIVLLGGATPARHLIAFRVR